MNAKGISVLKEEIQYHKECIEKIRKILALSESQSVSDNEQLQEFCLCTHNPPTRIIEGNIEICCECEYPVKQNG
jgi:hypothetical protein